MKRPVSCPAQIGREPGPVRVRVMQYNTGEWEANLKHADRTKIVNFVAGTLQDEFDFFCAQEVLNGLEKKLPSNWDMCKAGDRQALVFYNTNYWTPVDYVWPTTVKIGSKDKRLDSMRRVTGCKFRHNIYPDKKVVVLSAWFPHNRDKSNSRRQMQPVIDEKFPGLWDNLKIGPKTRVIMAGDFNEFWKGYGDVPFLKFMATGSWEARLQAPTSEKKGKPHHGDCILAANMQCDLHPKRPDRKSVV